MRKIKHGKRVTFGIIPVLGILSLSILVLFIFYQINKNGEEKK